MNKFKFTIRQADIYRVARDLFNLDGAAGNIYIWIWYWHTGTQDHLKTNNPNDTNNQKTDHHDLTWLSVLI